MIFQDIISGALVPGFGIGIGYLATARSGRSMATGYEPSWLTLLLALTWQFIILPANLLIAFLSLPWTSALLVFPSILPGAALGGLLSSAIGDRTAVLIGASVGLCIAGEKFHAYFGG
jgi:hypothetical protein